MSGSSVQAAAVSPVDSNSLSYFKEFYMKSFVKWFGIIALVAVIGFSMAACDDDSSGGGGGGGSANLIGTWTSVIGSQFIFTANNCTYTAGWELYNGPYTVSGNTITLNPSYAIANIEYVITIVNSNTINHQSIEYHKR